MYVFKHIWAHLPQISQCDQLSKITTFSWFLYERIQHFPHCFIRFFKITFWWKMFNKLSSYVNLYFFTYRIWPFSAWHLNEESTNMESLGKKYSLLKTLIIFGGIWLLSKTHEWASQEPHDSGKHSPFLLVTAFVMLDILIWYILFSKTVRFKNIYYVYSTR